MLLLFSGCVWLFATPWTVAHQAPLSMGFARDEYWSGLPFHFPGDLPDLGIKLVSPALASEFFTIEPPGKPKKVMLVISYFVAHICTFYVISIVCSGNHIPAMTLAKLSEWRCRGFYAVALRQLSKSRFA